MKNFAFLLLIAAFTTAFTTASEAQISAKLFRYADVSDTQIVFVYGGDIWLVPREGGAAAQVTHSPGEESWPRFSPDGSRIAYTASYNGNQDVYVMPVTGGLPTRVTYQSHPDRLVDWHPDGKRLLFASPRESARGPNKLFLVDAEGGLPERLAVPYGELASYSPDGKRLAYITKITENYPFKRYIGGLSSDIILFDVESGSAERVTDYPGNDGKPTWVGDKVYFLSDRGAQVRLNVWSYDTKTRAFEQVTRFADFDISMLAAGTDEMVFEAGGELYLLDAASGAYQTVSIEIVSDLSVEMARSLDVSGDISNMTASPKGKRVVFEARGELFNVPVKEGFVLNMTHSSGAFDRDPSWSPDGEHLAYWSDASGEYEIHLQAADGSGVARQLTQRQGGFGYRLYWSPDSKQLAFIDEKNDVQIVDIESGKTTVAGNHEWNVSHPGRRSYPIAWSPDSKWIAFSRGGDNSNSVVVLFDIEQQALHQVTSGFYNDSDPVFSVDGKYLFYLSDRDLTAAYSALGDGTWIYPNARRIASVGLTDDVPSLMAPRNDALETSDSESDSDTSDVSVTVDVDGFESRIVLLPTDAGNYNTLIPFEGKIAYRRMSNTGSGGGAPSLRFFDLEDREEKTILTSVAGVMPTADGKSLLVSSGGKYAIVSPAPDQKIEDAIPTDGLVMDWVPREEWRQIFTDTWRRYRDFFYDPDMHGVDWEALRIRYGALIDEARTRWDVSFVQSQLASELSAGHTYTRGGDTESVTYVGTGYLGIDWDLHGDRYRIARIVRPAEWDVEIRSPFDRPGVDVRPGDYVLAVNGKKLDPAKDPYASFEGLGGETVSVMISRSGDEADATAHTIELLTTGQERTLRYLEWIEHNRQMVDELSGGKLGYIYMSNTGGQGQLELVSMFYGQLDKEGFIIDERFNGGGQLADRFLELLERPVVYNLHWRHGRDHRYPIKTNTGPMGMLINGWAGSGGDGLPWAFQELEAGPIVGERTLGILVGPATGHSLIDGGGITVPGARLYDNDGHWFWEGEGVTPDIEVWDDPNLLMQGRDPQMERVVQEVMGNLEAQPAAMTPAPAREDRSGRSGAREGGR